MNLHQASSDDEDRRFATNRPAQSLHYILIEEIRRLEDFYQNLGTEYDLSIYEKFEKRFTGLRNDYKGKLQDISDPDYEFLNRSEMRKSFVEKILVHATSVAGQFQEAREKNHLDRVGCTDVLENLIYAMKNLSFLIGEYEKN